MISLPTHPQRGRETNKSITIILKSKQMRIQEAATVGNQREEKSAEERVYRVKNSKPCNKRSKAPLLKKRSLQKTGKEAKSHKLRTSKGMTKKMTK